MPPGLQDQLLAPLFGGLLVLVALVAMWSHVKAWREQREQTDLADFDLIHYRGRYRRRMQVSGLIGLVGVMIAVGDALVPWEQAKTLFAVYWIAVMLFAVWILILGVADMIATRAHTQAALARLRTQQRVLERQLVQAKNQRDAEKGDHHSGNGQG